MALSFKEETEYQDLLAKLSDAKNEFSGLSSMIVTQKSKIAEIADLFSIASSISSFNQQLADIKLDIIKEQKALRDTATEIEHARVAFSDKEKALAKDVASYTQALSDFQKLHDSKLQELSEKESQLVSLEKELNLVQKSLDESKVALDNSYKALAVATAELDDKSVALTAKEAKVMSLLSEANARLASADEVTKANKVVAKANENREKELDDRDERTLAGTVELARKQKVFSQKCDDFEKEKLTFSDFIESSKLEKEKAEKLQISYEESLADLEKQKKTYQDKSSMADAKQVHLDKETTLLAAEKKAFYLFRIQNGRTGSA